MPETYHLLLIITVVLTIFIVIAMGIIVWRNRKITELEHQNKTERYLRESVEDKLRHHQQHHKLQTQQLTSELSDYRHRVFNLVKAHQLAGVGSWVFEHHTQNNTWSDEVYQIFDTTPDQIKASFENYLKHVHPKDRALVESTYNDSTKNHTHFTIRHRLLLDNKHERWVELCGETLNSDKENQAITLCTIKDVSEQHQIEMTLKENNERYRSVIEVSTDGYWVLDSSTGQLLEVNDAYCQMSGYNREELLQMSINDLDVNESEDATKTHIQRVKEKGGDLFESQHRRKNGEIWPVEISVSYSSMQGGLLFVFLRNIEKHKLNESINQLRGKLFEISLESDENEIMQVSLDFAEQFTSSEIGFFHIMDSDQETITHQAWSTKTSSEKCFADGREGHKSAREAGVWADCLHQKRPVVYNDYPSLPHKKGLPKGHSKLKNLLTVPVCRNDKVVAVISVGNKKQDYNQIEIDFVEHVANIAIDFVERRKVEKRVEFMAYYDPLTGLPNREMLRDYLVESIARTKRSYEYLAVCYLDIDDFKAINDQYGQEAGDQILKKVSHFLSSNLGKYDFVARVGGDEFVIVLNELPTLHASENTIRQLLDKISNSVKIGKTQIEITASVGATIYPVDNSEPDVLIRHADQAMYQSKVSGHSSYHIYDLAYAQEQKTHNRIINEIDIALKQDQLSLLYQPKIDLRNGKVIGAEALVRWLHPEMGQMQPILFLPYLDGNALEFELGEWVVTNALEQMMLWRRAGHDFAISVNISPRQIQTERFADFIETILQNYPDDIGQNLELEILETADVAEPEIMTNVMKRCAKLGIKFSLDDFGTGYSSLSYFHRFPIDIVKIDQNFVSDMLDDARDLDIVEGVLHLAGALKRPVIAEGVESVEIGLMLLHLGCFYAQGFGIAQPMGVKKFEQWLDDWKEKSIWHQLSNQPHIGDSVAELHIPIFSHTRWLNKTVDYLKSNMQSDVPQIDDDKCMFTRWYKGTAEKYYGRHPSYPKLHKKHKELHQMASELIASNAQPSEKVSDDQIKELIKSSNEFIEIIKSLCK